MKVQIETMNRGAMMVATLHGELDHHAAENVRGTLDREIEATKVDCLILDLRGVTFMDSSGLGVILGRYKKMQAISGELVVTSLSKPVERLFEMSGLHKIMKIYKDRETAIKALKEVTK
ncbi:anti-sigma F factor antagonist [Sulfoacidibacillus thermotolerans]|uniref:Anti-sigma F factor antagonist n=1 Tax=Sulfoacidibacillus thermotolerans TaxID=1765684 RepID=A0A2U3D6R8_SULT2|nr:anti-sigma F factor antagonist [Sulfoacidibacillus thermotolerans]PWI56972.1 anti-sigma F factor antagonist [Sulfoacidibacillus thermotolerans]